MASGVRRQVRPTPLSHRGAVPAQLSGEAPSTVAIRPAAAGAANNHHAPNSRDCSTWSKEPCSPLSPAGSVMPVASAPARRTSPPSARLCCFLPGRSPFECRAGFDDPAGPADQQRPGHGGSPAR